MESAPPSYESATLTDYWDLVAHYLPSRDLTAAALVCSRWHATFAPHIWGNPASHFGIENDRVYVALTRFGRNLKTARLLVRSLTHTLHMPAAQAEIYNGPHTDWLRDMLERLPNLQSLIVRGLPFFDHGALQAMASMRKQAVDNTSPPPGVLELPASTGTLYQAPSIAIPSFGLRLLDASRCSNVTSSGLAAALGRFEGLLYLDLSFTYPARNSAVLSTLGKFNGLQVLKLRGISLRDEGVETLCKSIGRRVRSLDVRNNGLTDRSVRTLLDYCFALDAQGNALTGQRSPSLLPYLGSEMLEVYQGENFESYLRNAFTGRFVSRLAIEDVPAGGVTHLYISENALTVEGLSGLVRSGRLHVLDAGAVSDKLAFMAPSSDDAPHALDSPGCAKLVTVLAKHAHSMTFLRVGHDLVTSKALLPDQVVCGRVELDDTAVPDLPRYAAELDGASVHPEAHEMDANTITAKFELSGDSVHTTSSPTVIDDTYRLTKLAETPQIARRGSALAPEVVDEIDAIANQMKGEHLLSPSSALGSSPESSHSAWLSTSPDNSMLLLPTSRPRSYSSMAMERATRLAAHKSIAREFHPSMLPRITTLVLVNVPPYSADSKVADRIIDFIKHCAEESSLARCEAKLDYALPPGRRGHASALRHSATKLFAMKRLVLELAPANKTGQAGSSPWQHTDTRSMTEDRDSEKLWSAAETDFSFFGDEECVFPTIDETGRSGLMPGHDEKEVNFRPHQVQSISAPSTRPMIDNVAMISQFRKDRRLAHQRNLAAGRADVETEGLWDGIVQVVRHNNTLWNDEKLDYYGNLFTNNYLYR